MAMLLIEKEADVNVKDKDGKTPLHDAVGGNHKEMAMLLIEKGADVNVETKMARRHCTMLNNKEIAMLLIEKGAHVNSPGLEWQDAASRCCR